MAGPGKRKASRQLGRRARPAPGIGSRNIGAGEGVESAAPSGMMPPPLDPPHRTATPREVASSGHMSPSASIVEVRSMDSEVKKAWRTVTDAGQFFDIAQWSGALYRTAFVLQHSRHKGSLQDFLIEMAEGALGELRQRFKSEESALDWSKILPPKGLPSHEESARQDDLIFADVELRKLDYNLFHAKNSDFLRLLRTLIPRQARREHKDSMTVAVDAFNGEQRGVNGNLPSRACFEEVLDCFRKYLISSDQYLAPYTLLVGPSGIGKSFSVQQLAKSHNLYVSYATFGTNLTYPRRSPVVDVFNFQLAKDALVGLFEVFILFSLEDVRIIRELGVSPAEFFVRQVDVSPSNTYREDFARYFRNCWTALEDNLGGGSLTEALRYDMDPRDGMDLEDDVKPEDGVNVRVMKLLNRRAKNLRTFFDHLGAASKFTERPPGTTGSVPYAVICLDEARGLLQHGSDAFRAYRQALRNLWEREDDEQAGRKLFFGLLLDTSFKRGKSSPAARPDPSQKLVDPGRSSALFPPIYMIDSWDVFVPSQPGPMPISDATDIIRAKELLSFGRPLWGAYLGGTTGGQTAEHERICFVNTVASRKLNFSGDDEAQKARWRLALLSYRVDFDVFQYSWAEDLVSRWMRYITWINQERTVMHTKQPAEPLLAWKSLERMLDFNTRIEIIGEVQEQMKQGTIHLGDIGELVGALLLLFAYDHALAPKRSRSKWPRPIRLSEFMRSFLGDNVCEDVSRRVGSDIPRLRDLWKTGEVFFTHIERLSKPASNQVLREAYRRGAAVFLPQSAPVGNVVIPVYLPGSDKMSYFCVQIKNRKDNSFSASVVNEGRWAIDRAPSALGIEGAHMSMMMCLRAKEPEAAEGAAEDGDNPRIIEPPEFEDTRPETRSLSEDTSENPKLVLMAVGLNASIYPFLRGGDDVDESVAKKLVECLSTLLNCLTMSPDIESERQKKFIDHLRRH